MIRRVLVLATLIAALSGGTASAHEHKVLGTVTKPGTDRFLMKTTRGEDVAVKLTSETRIIRGKDAVKPQEIKSGTRVVVTTDSDEAPYTAKLIQVGAVSQPSGAKKD